MGKIAPIMVQEVVFASSNKAESRKITALLNQELIWKIAPRIYTSNLSDEPNTIINRNWYRILAHLYPKALLSHRSALEFKPTESGHIFLTYTYTEKVDLPGLTIHFLKGPERIEGDRPFFEDLYASQEARAFLENFQETQRKGAEPKSLAISEIEEKLEGIIRARGGQGLIALRDKAKVIARELGMQKEFIKLNELAIGLLPAENLRTGFSPNSYRNLRSPAGIARALGEPLDADRIKLLESLYEELAGKVFPEYKDQNTTDTAICRVLEYGERSLESCF